MGRVKTKQWGADKSDEALREMYDNAPPYATFTLEEIAVTMGITRERVRQIQEEALRKVRRRLWKDLKKDGYHPDELKR
tara:strand:- start:134 stop:370 length:237 start_codon:yes stop_codon:yes gene_type:complete